ncbi:hypothetical protein B0I35DRAFT_479748 [Stachybotrys elegans]|uniref:Uncharacterized protein n=1 Tax=Stachybotrys elegans TaxID=80388 RepID=A0A8K0WRU7_9HYPO|nr:hypothetical protein B0I35DRAFT_479748 [Stachybotrys elegans]
MADYPAFCNTEMDACDTISFKFGCYDNNILPLIKERRQRMNDLTRGSSYYVDVDPYFEGHRFYDEGVSEPSYRSPDVWFYRFEYWTEGTFILPKVQLVGDNCTAIWEDDGDPGNYFSCLLNNATMSGDPIDLSTLSNNVPDDGDVDLSSSGGSELPAFLARIFHPTIKGFGAYKQAFIDAYRVFS